jgi:hypothetical protein
MPRGVEPRRIAEVDEAVEVEVAHPMNSMSSVVLSTLKLFNGGPPSRFR